MRNVFFPGKNVFFWFAVSVFSVLEISCKSEKSTDSKIKTLISEYMKNNLHDYSSYEPVNTSLEFGDVVLDIRESADQIIKEMALRDSIWRSARSDAEKEKIILKADSLYRTRKRIQGWNVYHRYRSKNAFGATVLSDIHFVIDSQATKILRVNDSEDSFDHLMNASFNETNDSPAEFMVQSDDLIREFVIDDVAANKKYLEKVIVVNGKPAVVEIRKDSSGMIKFSDKSGSYALFSFEKDHFDKVKSLKPGATVSVKGVCSGSIYSELLSTTSINFKRSILVGFSK